MFASASKGNLKTLRYNFLTFSLRDFMQDSFTLRLPPPPISHKKSRAQ
ncbi:type III restriction endonuclease subunit R [Helicobacter pylori]|nr:type III restriction endonuclease subunit R [Helicobacter pylori]